MKKTKLRVGDVVQLDPETCRNPVFKGCLLTVTELKEWGVQGYAQDLGRDNIPGGQAFYRAKWDEMEFVGHAEWMIR